jgi:hypothetical protein
LDNSRNLWLAAVLSIHVFFFLSLALDIWSTALPCSWMICGLVFFFSQHFGGLEAGCADGIFVALGWRLAFVIGMSTLA